MSSRHQPLNGADAYDIDSLSADGAQEPFGGPLDHFCDLCGKRTYNSLLTPETHGGSTLLKCPECVDRAAQRYAKESVA